MSIKVYKVLSIESGSLAIMAKPDTSADPSSAFADLSEQGVTHLVSLLEPIEADLVGLRFEAMLCETQDIRFINFPISDMSVPLEMDAFLAMAADIYELVQRGQRVVVHCYAGIGRSGMMACAVIMQHKGTTASSAIEAVTKARGREIPDTNEQIRFIHGLEQTIKKSV